MSHPNRLEVFVVALCVHFVAALDVRGEKMPELPIPGEAVERAVAPEKLRAVAATTDDPDLLLGLAYLAKAGDPVRREISQRVVAIKPEYARVVAVLAVTIDGVDEANVAAILERDPNNAWGHYLRANLLRRADRDDEALEAFRKAAACRELQLYESVTSNALFKALDALGLKGRERLCALSWVATRASNFSIESIQMLDNGLTEIARLSTNDRREEISDLLLILAGHLYPTNFHNRWYAQRALQSAFRLKAEVAAVEGSPKMNGYVAVTQALVSTMIRRPGLDDDPNAHNVVQFLPSRVYHAFSLTDRAHASAADSAKGIPDERKPGFEEERQAWIKSADALIAAASKDPDGIVGAYLKGIPPAPGDQRHPWVSRPSYVERAMQQFSEVFEAAAAYEKQMDAVMALRQRLDPAEQNMGRMMTVGSALLHYAFQHDRQLPESIDVLYEQNYLDKNIEAKSLLSGRPYVFPAAKRRLPEKQQDRFQYIILYDDHELEGKYQSIVAIPGGVPLPVEEVNDRLKAQGK